MRFPKPCITVLHLAVICLFWTSPFFVPLKWIIVGAAGYYLQIKLLGGCILTKAEFGSYDDSAYWHYFNWIGWRFKKERVILFIKYAPLLILLIAVYRKFGRCLFC